MCIKFSFGEIYKLRFKMAQTALYISTIVNLLKNFPDFLKTFSDFVKNFLTFHDFP